MYVYVAVILLILYTGASKKNEYREKVIFLVTFIFSRFIICKVKHFKRFFYFILMIRAYSSLKSKIQYLKLLEYLHLSFN